MERLVDALFQTGSCTSSASFSTLPADVFRSPHEDTAYHYKFAHFLTLLSASQTTRLDNTWNHHGQCSHPTIFDLMRSSGSPRPRCALVSWQSSSWSFAYSVATCTSAHTTSTYRLSSLRGSLMTGQYIGNYWTPHAPLAPNIRLLSRAAEHTDQDRIQLLQVSALRTNRTLSVQ